MAARRRSRPWRLHGGYTENRFHRLRRAQRGGLPGGRRGGGGGGEGPAAGAVCRRICREHFEADDSRSLEGTAL